MSSVRSIFSQQPWYEQYEESLSSFILGYFKAQEKATVDYAYYGNIPGVLQTEEYARGILQEVVKCGGIPQNLLEERLRFRMDWQWAALEGNAKHVNKIFIIDESALYREVGDKEVMREQFLHLLRLYDHPNVAIHVLPFARPLNIKEMSSVARINFHLLIRGSFVPPGSDNAMVYIETVQGSQVFEGEVCRPYVEIINYVQDCMLAPEQSIEMVGQRAEALA